MIADSAFDNSKQKPRGVIVVDTNSLFKLTHRFPTKHFTHLEGTFGASTSLSDTLFYLAKNGYEIIIPEMVAYEAGSFLRDGKALRKYDGWTRPAHGNKTHKEWSSGFQAFFRKIRELDKNGETSVRIMPPLENDETKDAEFLNTLYSIHTNSSYSDRTKLHKIIAATKNYHLKNNAGERAAHSLIHSFQEDTVPIFFLSDDKLAKEAISQSAYKAPFEAISTYDFLNAFNTNDLLRFAGIQKVPVETIENTSFAPLEKHNFSVQTNLGQKTFHNGGELFNASLGFLKKQLDEISTEANQPNDLKPLLQVDATHSRIEAWNKKFGDRKR